MTPAHPPKPHSLVGRLAEDEAVEIVRQVGELSRARMALPGGLHALAAELDDRALRRVLESMAESLEAGRPIEEVVAELGDALPPHLAGLIVAGSRSGRLADRLVEFLAYYRVGDAIRRKLWLALFYPAVLLLLAVLAFGVLGGLLSEGLFEVFKDFGTTLPWMTRAIIEIARPFAAAGIWIVGGPLLCALVTWGLVRVLFRPAERRRAWHVVPLIGPVYRLTALAEFCQALAALVEADLPLVEALPLAARAARDPSLERPCAEAVADLADGRSLADALGGSRAFPEGLSRFLRWAEFGHSLPEALRLAAGIFEARARAQGEFAAAFLATLAVASVLWWILLVMLSLIWPMINIIIRLGF